VDVYCSDEFANQSDIVSTQYTLTINSQINRPLPPRINIFVGDKQNIITWTLDTFADIQNFEVYRAMDQYDLTSSDFSLIESLDGNQYSYTDYEVENGISYAYFVVAINKAGLRSVNFFDNSLASQSFVAGRPKSLSSLPIIDDFSCEIVGNNIALSWQPTGGVFDGYEIYKSVGNKYSFEYLTNVPSSSSYFLDQNALIKTAKIYYILRKYRNEAEPYVTESNNTVTNAVLLAKINIQDAVVFIDTSVARNIAGLEDPVRIETRKVLATHKHQYYADDDDRRINLNDQLLVIDWATVDNQTFTTSTDISKTSNYEVYLNNKK
jgi:hypothetical protein